MARNRVVRRSFGRSSPGRLTEWFADPFASAEVTLVANTFIIFSSLTAAGLAKRPFTITRTVGLLACRSDQAAAIEFPNGAVGGMVVSEKAVATGATAVPDPVTEASSDEWFMYQQWVAGGEASTNAGFPVSQYMIDSRAQRKVQDGEDFVIMIANASAADAITFHLQLRFLVKLS